MDRMVVILYDEAAEEDMRALRVYEVRRIIHGVDRQLRKDPMTHRRRKKLLEGLVPPWDTVRPVWQLRIGDFRVFYDVEEREEVIVRAVRRKGTKTTKEIL